MNSLFTVRIIKIPFFFYLVNLIHMNFTFIHINFTRYRDNSCSLVNAYSLFYSLKFIFCTNGPMFAPDNFLSSKLKEIGFLEAQIKHVCLNCN